MKEGFGVEPGIWFRLAIGGITGHRDFANDTGIIVRPEDATKVADAIVRVFIETGDRTNRLKARMKYVIDGMGIDKFLLAVEEKLGQASPAFRRRRSRRARRSSGMAHIGVHPQKQAGLNWIGVVLPVGRLTCRADAWPCKNRARSRRWRHPPDGLAEPADLGRGRRQASRWRRRDRALGLAVRHRRSAPGWSPAPATPAASSPPPTPNVTPPRSRDGAKPRVPIETPLNIHLTGCHHSCAQHYIGDIGLLAAQGAGRRDGDTVEGYHIYVGGGFGPDADARARDLSRRQGGGCAADRRADAEGLSRPPRLAPTRRSWPSHAVMMAKRLRKLADAEVAA